VNGWPEFFVRQVSSSDLSPAMDRRFESRFQHGLGGGCDRGAVIVDQIG